MPQQGRQSPSPINLVQKRRPSADGVQVSRRMRKTPTRTNFLQHSEQDHPHCKPIKNSFKNSTPNSPNRTTGRLSKNEYTFTAEASDNKARFRCEASNIMSQTPLKAEVDLTVLCKYTRFAGLAKDQTAGQLIKFMNSIPFHSIPSQLHPPRSWSQVRRRHVSGILCR